MADINRVIEQDAIIGMQSLDDESIDLAIIDPPYNIGIAVWDNVPNYREWIKKIIAESFRVLKPDGQLFLYCAQETAYFIDYEIQLIGFSIINRLVWYRPGGVPPRTKYKQSHEPLFWAVKDPNWYTFNALDIMIDNPRAEMNVNLKAKRLPHDVWDLETDLWYVPNLVGYKRESVGHPTQKPLALCNRIVLGHSNPKDTILVPFSGSGSECLSAKDNGRNFIAFENDPVWAERANQRIGVA